VREEYATPELAIQYFAYAEKTNQVEQLKQQARIVTEPKILRVCEKAEGAYQTGDMKEGRRQEDLWNEWKPYLPDTLAGVQAARIRLAKTEALVRVGKEAEHAARQKTEIANQTELEKQKAADLAKAESEKKGLAERLKAAEVAKAETIRKNEAERLKMETSKKSVITDEQRRLSYDDEMMQARTEAVAKLQKSEQEYQLGLVGLSNQRIAKIETIYGLGTPEALMAGDVEQKNWQAFVNEKKCDASKVAEGIKRIDQARLACRGKMASGLLQKALPKKSVDWNTILGNVEKESLAALTSQDLAFVNAQVTKLAEAIAKAKAADVPVAQATQTLQKLNMYRVVLVSPVRAAVDNPDRRVTIEWQDVAKQWQLFSRNTRIDPGKTRFRFTKLGYKSMIVEQNVLPGRTHRIVIPHAWESAR
jgi:hypothetical protein